ncbi:MAG TPA: cystathionine gamma-synthase family protein [Pseudomonadales bacterium]|nr:cystathionine gamma-synthase family protein [Pseudomonadales bacterium]
MKDQRTTKLGEHQLSPQSLMMGYGYNPKLSEGSLKPPIFLTSTFVFESCADGKRFFEGITGKRTGGPEGLVYGRFNGPDQEILEDRLALWEGAEEAAVFSTGMSAITTALMAHVRAGEIILHSGPLYAATEKLIDSVFGRLDVTFANFAAGAPLEEVRALIEQSRSKRRIAVIYLESPANPTNELVDIAGIVRLRDELYASDPENRPLIMVDNTFLGPVFQHPIRHGADVSLYSLTKYVGGHSDLVAGGIVGNKVALAPIMALRNTIGTITDPHTSWMLLRSLETVALRMERAESNARRVCEFLRAHPKVERVGYLGFLDPASPQGRIYASHCSGAGSTFSVLVKGGEAEAFRMLDALQLVKLAVSLGGTESLASHPASMTHLSVPAARRKQLGITDNLVRVSIGIESAADLVADFAQALDAV